MSRPRIDVPAYLQLKASQAKAGQESWWTDFESLYNRKLWHQLTMKLLEFVKRPEALSEDLVGLYDNFIVDFETRLNPFYLVEIVIFVIQQKSPEETLTFLATIKEKVKTSQDASILTSILMCRVKLALNDLQGVKLILEEISPLVDAETGVTPVHGRYFQLSSDYHQKVGNHNDYYRDCLRYLGCIDLTSKSTESLKGMAFALSLAALLGDSIYNFGELLQHPIIEFVRKDFPYLYELLEAFNRGDLAKYESLKPSWMSQPDLARSELHLREKITLLSLMEMTFQSQTGVLDFSTIAQVSYIPLEEVELLVMKALAKNLVKGSIDQVDQKVHLTWVQPRVLDKNQILTLRGKIDTWCQEVKKIEHLLHDKAVDIIS
jgi:26S proteasome regulatory subunit N9